MTHVLVNIDVDDLAKAESFYMAALGLSVGRRFGQEATELLGAQVPLYLLRKKTGTRPFPGAAATRSFERHWTPVHLDIIVDDIEAALERATQAGATVDGPINDEPYGKIVMLADPFGHGFCFIQLVGAGYDAIAT